MVSRDKGFAGDDLKTLERFMGALEPFRTLRHTIPLQYVWSFLLVASEEGLSVDEYAERAGVQQSVMSRHLLDIGDRNRHMDEGFGLVSSRPNPLNMRKSEIYLTPKGRAVANNIIRLLRK